MVFLSTIAEKYVGKSFEIDCVDIEIHDFEDNKPPIFKGPGLIRGDSAGLLTYRIYNQIPVNTGSGQTYTFYKSKVQRRLKHNSI